MPFDSSVVADAVAAEVDVHMDAQPYSIECGACGASLDFTTTVDSDYDLHIVVKPCVCQTKKEGE